MYIYGVGATAQPRGLSSRSVGENFETEIFKKIKSRRDVEFPFKRSYCLPGWKDLANLREYAERIKLEIYMESRLDFILCRPKGIRHGFGIGKR